jgi:hypothetical protein
VDGETGVLFEETSSDSLAEALHRVAGVSFDTTRIRQHAERFSRDRHMAQMRDVIADTASAPAGTRW